jgi:hypothetical protein
MRALFLIWILSLTICKAQTYTHPVLGLDNTYVGNCLEATCGGTYTDDGGTTANYSNNIDATYRTFCPNAAGKCVRLTFNSFSTQAADKLTLGNGATQNSTVFATLSGSPAVPFSHTANNASGCITVRFTSNANVNQAGWDATISCVPCAGGPTGTANSDCINFTPICNDFNFSGASTGPGIVSEGCSGCNQSENYSNWYKFQVNTGGTLGFTITSNNILDDYDFAIYGPNVSCGGLGAPIRCSYAAGQAVTGMSTGALDNSENVSGDGLVAPMTVTAGQTYYLMINKWSAGGSGFDFAWNLSGGATLDCSITVPVELINFFAKPGKNTIDLTWQTATEVNNKHFLIERSADGYSFQPIGKVEGAGNSNSLNSYLFTDHDPVDGDNYYRLKQVDFNHSSQTSSIVSVSLLKKGFKVNNVHYKKNSSEVELNVESNQSSALKVNILDVTSRILSSNIFMLAEGNNHLTYLIDFLPQGVYILDITKGEYNQKIKFIKN